MILKCFRILHDLDVLVDIPLDLDLDLLVEIPLDLDLLLHIIDWSKSLSLVS